MGKQVNFMNPEEADYALNNWSKMSPRELAIKLNKPVKYLNQWLKYKGIKNLDGKTLLHPEDKNKFIELFPHCYCKDMEKEFPYLTAKQILSIGERMGLKKSKEFVTPNYTEEELLDIFQQFYNKYGRNPNYDDFFTYKLPSYTTYCSRFGNIQTVCEKLSIPYTKFSTRYEGKSIGYIDEAGNRYDSFREKYVEDILIDLGFNDLIYNRLYRKIQPELKNILGERRFDWYSPYYNIFFEYFGMMKDNTEYTQKALEKIQLCEKANLKLVSIFPSDINNRSYEAGKRNIDKKINQVL